MPEIAPPPSASASPPQHYLTERELPFRLRLMRWLGHQTWAPRGTDRLLRTLHHPDSGQHRLFEVDFFGHRYRGNLAHYIDWLVFSYGAAPHSELALLRAAAEYLRKRREGPISFFDVGANVGHHTLFMSGFADQVFAFEPFPEVSRQLEDRLRLNRINNVRLISAGLSDVDQELPYFASTGANSGIGTFLQHGTDQYRATSTLPVRRGDPLFEALALPRIDLLKVDVEGYEPQVFAGLRERIHRDRPIVLTELMDSTRENFGSPEGLRSCFPEGSVFFGVSGPFNKRNFQLSPFDYRTTEEILVLPPEYAGFATLAKAGS